jgi:hypothetical protein
MGNQHTDPRNAGPWPYDPHNPADPRVVAELESREPGVSWANGMSVPDGVLRALMGRKVNAELTALRLTSPYLPITCLPSRTKIVVSAGVNDVRDVALPSDAELVQFYAPAGVVFYVSIGGRVVYPLAESDPLNGWNDCMVSPIGAWYYIGNGSKSVSIGLPFAGQVVSVGVI